MQKSYGQELLQGEQNRDPSLYKQPSQPDFPRVEPSFEGVAALDVTENEKIGPETRADDIKNDEFNRKI